MLHQLSLYLLYSTSQGTSIIDYLLGIHYPQSHTVRYHGSNKFTFVVFHRFGSCPELEHFSGIKGCRNQDRLFDV